MTTIDIHYPSARDLEEVMSSYLNSKQLLELLQSKGIFVFNAKKSELAKLAASYLYSSDELTAIRRKAYSSSSKSILSGFHLTSKKPFDMNAIYNELRDGFSVNAASDYSLKAIHKETGSKDGKPIYRGSCTKIQCQFADDFRIIFDHLLFSFFFCLSDILFL